MCALSAAIVLLGFAGGGVASGAKIKPTLHPQAGVGKVISTYSAVKSQSGRIAQSDPSLLGRTDSSRVNVMIKYDYDASASYTGDVAGLAATSPRVTGKSLTQNTGPVQAYNKYTAGLSQKISSAALKAAPGLKIRRSFGIVYGGVAASVPANQIGALLKTPGVVAVQKDALNHPMDDNTSFIGATNVWPTLGGSTTAGSNVVVAMLDTGVWPESPFFVDHGVGAPPKPLTAYHCDFGNGTDPALGPAFACNNKLIGAYNFTQTYMAVIGSDGQEFCDNGTGVCSVRDSEGHGTHTASTAAGDCVTSAILYGVDRGPVCGVAPGAHVIEYRVCLSQGCFSSDTVGAAEQAIVDGANVISYSISGGADPYTDPTELAFLDATNAGISVSAAAGNSGPGAGTADHGGPWVTTVGASTGPRAFGSTLHLTADGGATFDMPGGVTLTNGITTPTPVVLAQNLPGEDAFCQSTLAASTATGDVVMCERGINGRIDKGRRVLAGGAAGMILYNPVNEDQESDNHYLPAIHVNGPDTDLLAFVNGHTNVMATWAQGVSTPSLADEMAAFSSRGPLGDWIKPDVTAPGVQVLAGMTPQPDQTTADNGPPGNLFQAIAGTSMATPHAAGTSALVKAVHPTWSPEEIKSALMTSSVQDVVKEDGVTPASVFDDGAGSIRADRAVNPTLVFNETYADFIAAGTDHLHRVDLNIPSVDATTFTGDLTTQRTAINVSGKQQNLAVQITEPAGVTITVGNNNYDLHFTAGQTETFPIEISAPDIANGQYEARINLVPAKGGNTVTIPVAFLKTQGAVTLAHSCAPTTFAPKGSSHCTVTAQNLGSTPATASLTVTERETGKTLQYKNVAAPGSVIGSGDGVQWSGPLGPSIAPAVNSITPGGGEPYGYVPLSALGVSPLPGTGDETITNEGFNTFYFGGEPYNTVGAVSDGYAVVGGGDSNDINYLPQIFPNAARPNNVVAPFWTDLNPSFGGAMYMAQVGDGSDDWVVVDFEAVRNYDTADPHTFEIWFRNSGFLAGSGPASEQVTIVYGSNGIGDPDGTPNWGAENRDGSSGKNLPSYPGNGAQLTVNMGAPTPGGSVSIPFDVTGKKVGTYHSDAKLTSNVTPGTTIVPQTLTIGTPTESAKP